MLTLPVQGDIYYADQYVCLADYACMVSCIMSLKALMHMTP
jgi:hypothetical protein